MFDQDNSLNVIQKIDKKEANAKLKMPLSDERVITIDKKTGEVVPKASWLDTMSKSLVYYLVNGSKSFARRDLKVEVVDFSNDRTLNLTIDYRANCEFDIGDTNAEKLAKALHSEENLGAKLDDKIKRWFTEAIRDLETKIIDDYFNTITSVKTSVQEKAKRDAGLRLDLRFSRDMHQSLDLIINGRDPSCIAERNNLILPVKDVSSGRSLDLSVSYRAGYVPTEQDRFARSFTSSTPLVEQIDLKIKEWAAEFIYGEAADFISNYSAGRQTKLKDVLERKARQDAGLLLDLRLQLDKAKQAEPLQIGPTEITVYVSDSDEAFDLQLQTELLVEDVVQAIAGMSDGGVIGLINLVKAEIKKYLLESVTTSQFYYELKDTVRSGLADHLNSILKKNGKGRKIGHLSLDSKKILDSPAPKELVEIGHVIKCKVQKHPSLISVENTLEMLPQDARRYASAQSPNLQSWVESKLEKIIKPLLLAKKYVDILDGFEKEAEIIQNEMSREARSIGYAVQHIVSIPRLAHLDLKDNFEILDEHQEFSTNTSSIKVELSTTVNAKFESFGQIEDYLNESVDDIKELMRKTVNSVIRETLRSVDPERFYMKFYVPTEGEHLSLEQELKKKIETALFTRFGVKVNSVVPIPEQTDIIDHVQRLLGIVGEFTCEVPSHTGGSPVTFTGDFKVLSIQEGKWYKFQSSFLAMRQSQKQARQELTALQVDYDDLIEQGAIEDNRDEIENLNKQIRRIEKQLSGIAEVQKTIEKSIKSNLFATIDSQVLEYADGRNRQAIEQKINQWAQESVADQYGLLIEIRHLSRSQTEQEKAQHTLASTKLQKSLEQSRKQIEENATQSQKELETRTKKHERLLDMSLKMEDDKYEQLKRFYKLRADLQLAGDVEELKDVEEKIQELENSVKSGITESKVDYTIETNLLKPKTTGASNFIEGSKHLSLPSKNETNASSDEPDEHSSQKNIHNNPWQ
jgi:hypothetical protein